MVIYKCDPSKKVIIYSEICQNFHFDPFLLENMTKKGNYAFVRSLYLINKFCNFVINIIKKLLMI